MPTDTSDFEHFSDEAIRGAFAHALTMLDVQPDGSLAALDDLDAETILRITEQLVRRTGNGDTVRDCLDCALAFAVGDAVASRALIDEGYPVAAEHREFVRRYAIARTELPADQIAENIAEAQRIGA